MGRISRKIQRHYKRYSPCDKKGTLYTSVYFYSWSSRPCFACFQRKPVEKLGIKYGIEHFYTNNSTLEHLSCRYTNLGLYRALGGSSYDMPALRDHIRAVPLEMETVYVKNDRETLLSLAVVFF